MQRYLLIFLFVGVLCSLSSNAQTRVTFQLDSTSLTTAGNVFIAGSFNNWNPGDTSFRFINRQLTITVAAGASMQYKLTKGSWQYAESDAEGKDISNHVLNAFRDTTITLFIKGFKNDTVTVRKHTASKHVVLMDTAFYMPQLDRTRKIRLYLPPDYYTTSKKYPVLYMADGQNCFDEYTSAFGEWQVDESLDRFYDSCGKSMIVVAIDNGDSLRMSEYDAYIFRNIKPEGKQYAAFVAETLKPYIDKNYRTKPLPAFTHVAGSSMGGLISMYILSVYPQKFGSAGIFSPAFWISDSIYTDVKKLLPGLKGHSCFFYAGGNESKKMVQEIVAMHKLVTSNKKVKASLKIDEAGGHNETAWRKWFPVYLQFILQ